MAFHFFTLGGKQFWEDVFYYQKWRIQRHFRTKKYRLLDNFDICRASGTFDECRKAFVKFIEVYEIARQKGKLVILLHGLGESKNIFRPLWKALSERGYNVAAINYPSTRKSMRAHLDQLDFFLTHVEDVDEVSFITKGSGCLLLRCLLTESFAWKDKFKLGRVVNVNPNNCGNEIATFMSRFRILNFIFGASLKETTPQEISKFPRLPAGVPLGLVFCETYLDKILKPLRKKYGSIDIPGEMTEKNFSADKIFIKNSDLNIFDNEKVIQACINYIEKGKF